jgi:hypothetical protein
MKITSIISTGLQTKLKLIWTKSKDFMMRDAKQTEYI